MKQFGGSVDRKLRNLKGVPCERKGESNHTQTQTQTQTRTHTRKHTHAHLKGVPCEEGREDRVADRADRFVATASVDRLAMVWIKTDMRDCACFANGARHESEIYRWVCNERNADTEASHAPALAPAKGAVGRALRAWRAETLRHAG